MRIDQIIGKGRPTISFEFFPPKTDAGFAALFETIDELKSIKPDYVSVTYGAGGSTREKTVQLVTRIQTDLSIRSMAHLTCVGHTADEIGHILDELWTGGVRNILALRGDPPSGQSQFTPTEGGFATAAELVKFIAARHDFCIGTAGFPEGHPQCLNKIRDLKYLKRKVEAGADFIVTQLFFDNADFYEFRDAARAMGITIPIVAGIMPILNVSQIKRFVSMCGAKIPEPLLMRLEELEADPDAVHAAGVEHATQQCRDLIAHGVDGIHFYTLNKSKATARICQTLRAENLQA